ncbi:hypothetical protein HYALB_00012519 [Hymenoscyphus albidus]|uniref:Uncharacterized protein n=1 Tax=Hymenoscyphus albidus TaxID=595503 RepID=A0A9N9LQB4_9HELO|nr:hypothetical protein HYALB_00012519 [Hymenoscyphus albidus]
MEGKPLCSVLFRLQRVVDPKPQKNVLRLTMDNPPSSLAVRRVECSRSNVAVASRLVLALVLAVLAKADKSISLSRRESLSAPLKKKDNSNYDVVVDEEPSLTDVYPPPRDTSPGDFPATEDSSDGQKTVVGSNSTLFFEDGGATLEAMDDTTTFGDFEDSLDWALTSDDYTSSSDPKQSLFAFDSSPNHKEQSLSRILTAHASAAQLGNVMTACASRCLTQASNAVQWVMLSEQLVDIYAALVGQLSDVRTAVSDGTPDAEIAATMPLRVSEYMIESAVEKEAILSQLVNQRMNTLGLFAVTHREQLGRAREEIFVET